MERLRAAALVALAALVLLAVVGTRGVSAVERDSLASLRGTYAPPAQQQGRSVNRSDWVDHIPVFVGAVLLVVVVDGLVIARIIRERRRRSVERGRPGGRV